MLTSDEIDEVHARLRLRFDAGEIGEDTYFCGVIGISSQLATAGLCDDAARMLSRVPVSYIRTVLPVQMAENGVVLQLATSLAKALDSAGLAIAPDEEIPLPLASPTETAYRN
jgi:hypothetical protein